MALLDLLSEQKRQPAECVIELDGGEIDTVYPALVEVVRDSCFLQSGRRQSDVRLVG